MTKEEGASHPDSSPEAVAAMVKRLTEACNGHPAARIPWPHRLLHEAAALLSQVDRLSNTLKLHAGDTTSLANESEMWREQAIEEQERADTASRQLAAARAALLEMADECRRLNGSASPREAYLTPKARALLSGETK